MEIIETLNNLLLRKLLLVENVWQLRMHCNLRPSEPRQPFPTLITTRC